ncbi:MAG: hypothetical protein AAF318_00940 [Pseudomonadota bacterium]
MLLPKHEDQKRRLNIKSWGNVAKLFYTYTRLSNIESTMDFKSDDILAAIPRMLWPQYDWQLGYENMFRFGRAWHVYATPQGKKAFRSKHGIDLDIFIKAAFGVFAATEYYPAARPDLLSSLNITKHQAHLLRCAIGQTVTGHAKLARASWTAGVPRDFQRSITKERPLFEATAAGRVVYFVPSRSNLLLRVTDGLYYDIVSDDYARVSSGEAFEGLCLKLAKLYFNDTCLVQTERATSYGKSADIIVESNSGANGLIIECKIRRIPERVLTSPDPWANHAKDFEDIIKGIFQIWRTHKEYYHTKTRKMTGIVVQYDPWTIASNTLVESIFKAAHAKADQVGIPQSDRIPVALAGYVDVERSFRASTLDGLQAAICSCCTDRFRGFELFTVVKEINRDEMRKESRLDYSRLAGDAVPWFRNPAAET